MDINKVIIAGNLTRDPELKNTTGNKQLTRFSIASNRSYKAANGERQKETLFTNVVAWGGQAETCAKYLRKGSKVLVVGRLSSREFDGDDGQKKKLVEVVAEEVQFLTPKGQDGNNGNNYNDTGTETGADGW